MTDPLELRRFGLAGPMRAGGWRRAIALARTMASVRPGGEPAEDPTSRASAGHTPGKETE